MDTSYSNVNLSPSSLTTPALDIHNVIALSFLCIHSTFKPAIVNNAPMLSISIPSFLNCSFVSFFMSPIIDSLVVFFVVSVSFALTFINPLFITSLS